VNPFKRRSAPVPTTIAQSLQHQVSTDGGPSLFAHSEFVKKVNCSRCGARKQLPSRTAYLYCDRCGCLVDYDFRLANADTNAGLSNTVFHRLMAPFQAQAQQARSARDADGYRTVMRGVFTQWIRQCPEAVSPRARDDEDFRGRMIDYLVESSLCKDFDPALTALEERLNVLTASLQRIPRPGQPWLASDGIWEVAVSFRALMEATYRQLETEGVLALDPDRAPPGVPLAMEYSTFCQAWLPHLQAADAQRLLSMFALSGEYARVDLTGAVTRRCGGCGGELVSLPEAEAVVCQGCGRRLDLSGGQSPCQGCGAALCFPGGVSRLNCPYCQSTTHRA
jgi:hypothetical protein